MIQRDIKALEREKILSNQIIDTYKENLIKELKEVEDIDEIYIVKKSKNNLWKSILNVFK